MTVMTQAPTGSRRSALVAEVIGLVLVAGADAVVLLAAWHPPHGAWAPLFVALTPAIGPAAGIVAVLRRWFGRVRLLAVVMASVSIAISVLSWSSAAVNPQPAATEILALALLTGALLRRHPLRDAAPLVGLSGVAMAVAFPLRFGVDSSWALVAVPAALVWGASIAVGLALRDVDVRLAEHIEVARAAERLALARDLHDFVAHHITGIVVLAQGARLANGPESEVLGAIEHAGGEALTAMRRLVGMLRDPGADGGLRQVLRDACGPSRDVRLSIDEPAERAALPVEIVAVAHRIVLEGVTNARRHAPTGTQIEVSVRIERQGFTGTLVLDIVNVTGSAVRGTGGYGLVGMAERVTALGGTFSAGSEAGNRWHVAARLPLPLDPTWENV